MYLRTVSLLALAVAFACPSTLMGDDEQPVASWDVNLASAEDGIPDAISKFKSVLSNLHPKTTHAPIIETLKSPEKGRRDVADTGSYLLYGDLFHDDSIYAVVEISGGDEQTGLGSHLNIGVGFARWNGKEWEIRQMLPIVPVWRPKGWKPLGQLREEGFGARPTEKPFWLQDFNGDGIPELMIAGGMSHHSQQYDLFKFDRDKKCLKLIQGFGTLPEVTDGWITVEFDSGHKAYFSGCKFYRWSTDQLILRVEWQEGDYPGKTEADCYLSTFDEQGKPKSRFSIRQINPDKPGMCYMIEQDDRKKCELSVTWLSKELIPPKPGQPAVMVDPWANLLLNAYVFERLSGLPRSRLMVPPISKIRLEDCAKIAVTGDPDLVQCLSEAKK